MKPEIDKFIIVKEMLNKIESFISGINKRTDAKNIKDSCTSFILSHISQLTNLPIDNTMLTGIFNFDYLNSGNIYLRLDMDAIRKYMPYKNSLALEKNWLFHEYRCNLALYSKDLKDNNAGDVLSDIINIWSQRYKESIEKFNEKLNKDDNKYLKIIECLTSFKYRTVGSVLNVIRKYAVGPVVLLGCLIVILQLCGCGVSLWTSILLFFQGIPIAQIIATLALGFTLACLAYYPIGLKELSQIIRYFIERLCQTETLGLKKLETIVSTHKNTKEEKR